VKIDYVQLEAKAFLADLIGMSTVESGAYVRLIFYLYANNGSCPNDVNTISEICGKPRNFGQIWKRIGQKFQVNGAVICHKRVTKELTEANTRRREKKDKAAAAAAVRWGKNADFDKNGQCKRNADAMPQAMQTQCTSNATVNGNGNINNSSCCSITGKERNGGGQKPDEKTTTTTDFNSVEFLGNVRKHFRESGYPDVEGFIMYNSRKGWNVKWADYAASWAEHHRQGGEPSGKACRFCGSSENLKYQISRRGAKVYICYACREKTGKWWADSDNRQMCEVQA
jgi:uncharacterized protein YdaU (DUF1376 family)